MILVKKYPKIHETEFYGVKKISAFHISISFPSPPNLVGSESVRGGGFAIKQTPRRKTDTLQNYMDFIYVLCGGRGAGIRGYGQNERHFCDDKSIFPLLILWLWVTTNFSVFFCKSRPGIFFFNKFNMLIC